MDTVKKQVFLSTVFSYAGVIVGAISQWFIVPNVLTKAENGLLAVLLSYMYILIQLSNLGFNSAGGRFFPSFYNPKKGHNGYLFTGIFISIIGFLICLIGLYFYKNNVLLGNSFLKQIEILKPLFKTENSEKSALFIKYFYLLIPITLGQLLFNIFDNYAKNLYDTATGTFLSQFFQRFWLLISFIVLALDWVDFEGFIWIWSLAFIIPTVLMIIRSIRLGGFSLKPDFSIFTTEFRKPFVNYSALTVLTGFSTMIIMYIDKIMLGLISGLEDAGVYNTASFFGSVMGMSLMATSKATAPLIATSMQNNDFEKIDILYKKSCLTQLIVGCWILAGILINIDNLFAFLPPDYEAGKWVIIILGFAKLYDLATGLNGLILVYSKYYRYDTYSMLSLIVFTIIANFYFIPRFGLTGAAIAAGLATIYFNTVRYFIVWIKLGLQPFDFQNIKVLLIATLITYISYILPPLGESKLMVVLDIAYRSILLTVGFGYAIFVSKVSPELNQIGLNLIGKFFRKL